MDHEEDKGAPTMKEAYRPIETAPTDREIFVWNAMYGWYRTKSYELEGHRVWPLYGLFGGDGGVWYPRPTYWMEVPASPDGSSTCSQFGSAEFHDKRHRASAMADMDPLDTPLPCDVKIEHITFRKGVSLRTLVNAAARWNRRASPTGVTADAQDAARYRWLRSMAWGVPFSTGMTDIRFPTLPHKWIGHEKDLSNIDAVIDARISASALRATQSNEPTRSVEAGTSVLADVVGVNPTCPQHGGSGVGAADLSLMECTCGVRENGNG